MKKADVRLGGVYEARVSGKLARVRIDRAGDYGGWEGTNLDTNHFVFIKTAGRLRKPLGIAPPTSVADLWRQWQALKESNPGTLLVFRVGDMFEVYGDDATVCSKVLGLTTCKSVNNLDPIDYAETPMTGFPYADLEANIRRLVAAGHKVAVCERVLPGEGRKPVEKIVMGLDGKRVTVRQATASDTCSPFDDVA